MFIKPKHSKTQVNKAAQRYLDGSNSGSRQRFLDIQIVENWRGSHAHVINTFQAMLRNRTRGTDIFVAQRHKRRSTIFDKLRRHPKMQLARMQDIAGCRLIFGSQEELYKFRHQINYNNRFNHVRINNDKQYDYIANPKASGYRGVHDIFSYQARTLGGSAWNGLQIEIQYRTLPQHAWATAVEIAGNISHHQPKFNRGDTRYIDFFRYASEIIARYGENQHSCLPHLDGDSLINGFMALEKETGLLNAMRNLRPIDEYIRLRQNYLLYFDDADIIQVEPFESQLEAINRLFDLEEAGIKDSPVFVRADSIEALKTAYRNYFSDANDFIGLIEGGIRALGSAG